MARQTGPGSAACAPRKNSIDRKPSPSSAEAPAGRRNILLFIWNPAVWNTSMSLISPVTIMPVFVSLLTTSTVIVGAVASFFDGTWALTQLAGARYFERFQYKRRRMVFISMCARSTLVIYGFFVVISGAANPSLTLVLFFVTLLSFRAGTGITSPAYADIFAKVVSPRVRGRVIGTSQAVGVTLGALGVTLATRLLGKSPPPEAFGPLLMLAGAMLTIGFSAMLLVREPPSEVPDRPPEPLWRLADRLRRVFGGDPRYRRYVAGRIFTGWGMMGFSLVSVYSARELGGGLAQIGLYTSVMLVTQIVSLTFWGYLQDRVGGARAAAMGALAAILATLLAGLAPSAGYLYGTYALMGIALSAFGVSDFAVAIEVAPKAELPSYWAAFNTALFPLLMPAAIVAGLIVDLAGFRVMFAVALAFALFGAVLLARTFPPRRALST